MTAATAATVTSNIECDLKKRIPHRIAYHPQLLYVCGEIDQMDFLVDEHNLCSLNTMMKN